MKEMKQFNIEYESMCQAAGNSDFKREMSRCDNWGPIGWARPPDGALPKPSWQRGETHTVASVRDMDFGERV